MQKESNLAKEINSLDMMINALAVELATQLGARAQTAEARKLVSEITEALEELRLARGVRKLLLSASAGNSAAVENNAVENNNNRISRKSSVRLSPAA